MNPTFTTLHATYGVLQTGAPSLDRYDDRLLADLGLDRYGWPTDGSAVPAPRKPRSFADLVSMLLVPFRGIATQLVNG